MFNTGIHRLLDSLSFINKTKWEKVLNLRFFCMQIFTFENEHDMCGIHIAYIPQQVGNLHLRLDSKFG